MRTKKKKGCTACGKFTHKKCQRGTQTRYKFYIKNAVGLASRTYTLALSNF